MFLALLAVTFTTPALCPGGYPVAVSRAASLVGVAPDLFIEVVPREFAPRSNQNPSALAASWVPSGDAYDFNWTIFIRYDMLHAMSCAAMKVVALHEVCHIKNRHYIWVSQEQLLKNEEAADVCAREHSDDVEWKEGWRDAWEAHLLAERERIRAPAGFIHYLEKVPR
jgi:hypothetical protein